MLQNRVKSSLAVDERMRVSSKVAAAAAVLVVQGPGRDSFERRGRKDGLLQRMLPRLVLLAVQYRSVNGRRGVLEMDEKDKEVGPAEGRIYPEEEEGSRSERSDLPCC